MTSVNIVNYFNRSIEYLYYALFLIVPLILSGSTSELFEFNKMWITFGITTLILALWFSKMVILKKVVFKRTILDVFILLFLISQIISTVISLDSYVSLWGYYSRWNGGLLSTLAYIALYYGFVSNFFTNSEEKDSENKSWLDKNPTAVTVVKRSLLVSLISGFIVAIWAIPSHFGYDFTCLVFRGTFDVSCWTADFQPKVRVFGPLGQPNWLAGYMGILIPIALAFVIDTVRKSKNYLNPFLIFYAVSFILFYLTLLYTSSRSGMASSIFTLGLFIISYIFLNRKDLSFLKNKLLIGLMVALVLVSFFAEIKLPVAEKFSLSFVKGVVTSSSQTPVSEEQAQAQSNAGAPAVSSLTTGISGSGEIRNIVWRGGLDAWRANPIFGTGVETFAFAYYKYRPVEHNMVSEWNFLYNKAHNEYINYLTTTGLFGFLTYMSIIFVYIFIVLINLTNKKIKEIGFLGEMSAPFKVDNKDPLILSLLFSFISILIVNFFGFSVVILNIYLFMIPVFTILLLDLVKQDEGKIKVNYISYAQWTSVAGLLFGALFIIYILFRFWVADTAYALGKNLDGAQAFEQAYPQLQKAVDMRKAPVFEDELAVNKAVLAVAIAQQENSSQSAEIIQQFANDAVTTSEKLVKEHPNNIVFSKSRVRILYTLAAIDPRYYNLALDAVKQTAQLAPTDASILYNLGVLYGQTGDIENAVKVLEKTIEYKPDYREARYALALFYHDLGVDSTTGQIKDEDYRKKSIDELNFILEKLDPNYQLAIDSLSAWKKEK